jgi:hypothetical protein
MSMSRSMSWNITAMLLAWPRRTDQRRTKKRQAPPACLPD